MEFVVVENYNLYFLAIGLDHLQMKLYQIFNTFSGVRKSRNHVSRLDFGIPVFQTEYDIIMPCGFLAEFQKIRSHLKTRGSYHVLTFGSRRDAPTMGGVDWITTTIV